MLEVFLKLTFLTLIINISFAHVSSSDVSCEKLENIKGWFLFGNFLTYLTCFMQKRTIIDSPGYTISDGYDPSVEGLTFQGNKKISYLPVKVSQKFPNLKVLDAGECSIKAISSENFKGLSKLLQVFLCCNQIEIIKSDTFVDLPNVAQIGLDKNRIKFIEGETFRGFTAVADIWLTQNNCIDEDFHSPIDLSTVTDTVTDKCGNEINYLNSFKCGQVLFGSGNVIGGSETKRGQWPFLVSLYSLELDMHICGGSLISRQHVITAAHCIKNKWRNETRLPSELAVLLGKYNLGRLELESIQVGVKEIRIHPNWRSFTEQYDSDVTILVLKKIVEFSTYIQPVCLAKDDKIEENSGVVAGWGRSEFTGAFRHEMIPRQASVQAVTAEFCYTTNPKIASISSVNTFCGLGKVAGPCNGDSGGGFFVKVNQAWTLEGIISASLATGDDHCGVESFSVYTNVGKFLEWIYDVVRVTSDFN